MNHRRICAIILLAAAAVLGAGGPASAAPANDSFAGALTLSGPLDSDSISTVTATEELGEPNPVCSFAGATVGGTVWYKFTTASSGRVAVTTLGSDFDTVLAVYKQTGSGFSGLSLVGCNDDADPSGFFLVLQSAVQASVSAGTYFVQVGGWDFASGQLQLSFAQV